MLLTVDLSQYAPVLPVIGLVLVELRQTQQHFPALLHPAMQKPHIFNQGHRKYSRRKGFVEIN